MVSAADMTARGALCTQAELLRSRVRVIRETVRTLPNLAEAGVVDALTRLQPFIYYLAAHGRAEEHILYPHAEKPGGAGFTSLRQDHLRLEGLATAIAAWTPAVGRPKLALLLTAFCDTAEAHLALEADCCLSIVHEHSSARKERYLYGETEIETFETARQ